MASGRKDKRRFVTLFLMTLLVCVALFITGVGACAETGDPTSKKAKVGAAAKAMGIVKSASTTQPGMSMDSAIPLSLGENVRVSIPEGCAGLYYSFTPSHADTYIATSDNNTDDPLVILYDENGERVDSSDDGAVDSNFKLVARIGAGEKTYFFFTDFDAGEGRASSYNVTLDKAPVSDDGFIYYENYRNDATIAGYNSTSPNVVIPSHIGDMTVTIIDDIGSDSAITISIPATVYSIGREAFAGCPNLESLTVAEDNSYFRDVDGVLITKYNELHTYPLGKKTLAYTAPSNITGVYSRAFANCKLESVVLPQKMESINEYAFSGCRNLSDVTLPDNLQSIESGAFENCVSLKSIDIPESMTYIDKTAFEGCADLTIRGLTRSYAERYARDNSFTFESTGDIPYLTLTLGEEVTSEYKPVMYCVMPIQSGCYAFKDFGKDSIWSTVQNNDNEIVDSKWSVSTGYGSVMYSVMYIDLKAGETYYVSYIPYEEYEGEFTIIWEMVSVTDKGIEYDEEFYRDYVITLGYIGSESEVYVPARIEDKQVELITTCTFRNNATITSVEFEEGTGRIDSYGFSGCANLTDVVISKPAFDVDVYTFSDCPKLTNVFLPDTLRSISNYAFKNCVSLKSIDIPKSVTYIQETAFEGCTDLVIRGIAGSYAETFARDNNIRFVPIVPVVPGDVDNSGAANGEDARLILEALATGDSMSEEFIQSADYNEDGAVSLKDVVIIMMKAEV